MPKKTKSKKNSSNTSDLQKKKRILIFKEDMEEYAQVIKILGDCRITVMMPDKTEVMAIIPGRFRKRCWMKPGDVVIISRRSFQESKFDVVYKYNEDEVRNLITYYEIPEFFVTVNVGNDEDEYKENFFEFRDEDPEDIDGEEGKNTLDISEI
jgi:translation initiation factor 1A